MRREKVIEWGVQITALAFSIGGAYFMLKDHERRISKNEEQIEKKLSKEDFAEYKRESRWGTRPR